MKVLIVGRTKMGRNTRCIGGLCANGRSVRLLDVSGHNFSISAPFQPGQLWELHFHDSKQIRPPHVEDVLVTAATALGTEKDVKAAILALVQPWRGSSSVLFDGLVSYTANNNGYIETRIPDRSTWFWIPSQDLTLRSDGKHYDYPSSFVNMKIPHGLSYVGEATPPAVILAGTLVRVSLARWWRPDETYPERCYLQLSGWF